MAAANALLMAIARVSPMLARGIWRASRQWMLWDEQCMSRFALLDQDKAAMQVWTVCHPLLSLNICHMEVMWLQATRPHCTVLANHDTVQTGDLGNGRAHVVAFIHV
jgi:hypothetical protein